MNEEFDVEDDIEDDIDCLWPQLLQEASQKEDNSSSPNELLIEASQKFDINVWMKKLACARINGRRIKECPSIPVGPYNWWMSRERQGKAMALTIQQSLLINQKWPIWSSCN